MQYTGIRKQLGTLKIKQSEEEMYENLASGVTLSYDFDPTTLANPEKDAEEQHVMFCKFLDQRALSIDIWDGDTLQHYGICKVPLYLAMRQGDV